MRLQERVHAPQPVPYQDDPLPSHNTTATLCSPSAILVRADDGSSLSSGAISEAEQLVSGALRRMRGVWPTSRFELLSPSLQSPKQSHDQWLDSEWQVFTELLEDQALARASGSHLLQHLTGIQGFFGHAYQVGEGVLVPRPETECLLEVALAVLRQQQQQQAATAQADRSAFRGLELGVGSGILSLELLLEFEGLRMLASDVSPQALGYAQINAASLLGVPGLSLHWAAEAATASPSVTRVLADEALSLPPGSDTTKAKNEEKDAAKADPIAENKQAGRRSLGPTTLSQHFSRCLSHGQKKGNEPRVVIQDYGRLRLILAPSDPAGSGKGTGTPWSEVFWQALGLEVGSEMMDAENASRSSSPWLSDFIISNPPYLQKNEAHAEVIAWEPHQALFPENGQALAFYQAIAEQGADLLKPGGFVFLEIPPERASEIAGCFAGEAWQQASLQFFRDLNQWLRVMVVQKEIGD